MSNLPIVTPRSTSIRHNKTVTSWPSSRPDPLPTHRVTPSHRITGLQLSSDPVGRLGVSPETAAPGERTERATPFLADADLRAYHRSTCPHRLRFSRRQRQQ